MINKIKKILRITHLGFSFKYKNNDVIWLWPWNRKNGQCRYLSVSTDALLFNSLKDIDLFWDNYNNGIPKLYYRDDGCLTNGDECDY